MKQIFKPAHLVLALIFIGCSTEKLKEPLAYSFDSAFVGYSLPSVQISNPAPTSFTLAEVNSTKSNLEALEAFKNSQLLTVDMDKSLNLIQSSVKSSVIADLENSFGATELAAIALGQPINEKIQKNINTLLSSGAIDAFRSELVLPTIDGKNLNNVVLQKSAYQHVFGVTTTENPDVKPDKCNQAAYQSYSTNKVKVDTDKTSTEQAIVNSFNNSAASANKQYEADKIATAKKYADARAKAIENFNMIKAKINANKQLSSIQKSAAIAIEISLLNDQIAKLNVAEKEQEKADVLKRDTVIAKANFSKDSDLLKVITKYTAELEKLNTTYRTIKNNCHNQGGNGNGNGPK